MSACLHISKKPHVQLSQNFLCVLSMAVIQSFIDDSAVCYVLLVLWMTSCLLIIYHAEVMPIGRIVKSHLPGTVQIPYCS